MSNPAKEFRDRLERDRSLLTATSAGIADIRTGLSDPHRGNRQVARVVFDNGDSWFYKPRSLWPERHFAQTAATLEAADQAPFYRLVERPTYGWMSDVSRNQQNALGDRRDYWARTAAVVAVMHLLGVTDIHTENLIDDGSCLVPVDLECIAQPLFVAPISILDDGPAAIGVLPRSMRWYTHVARDMSGLHRSNLPSEVPAPELGVFVDSYRDAIIQLSTFAQDSGAITNICDELVRVLLRQTGEYLPFVGAPAAAWREAAPPCDPSIVDALGSDAIGKLIEIEALCLSQGDVPLVGVRDDQLLVLTADAEIQIGSGLARRPDTGVAHRVSLARSSAIVEAWCDDVRLRLTHGGWIDTSMRPSFVTSQDPSALATPLRHRALSSGTGAPSWPAEWVGGFSGTTEMRTGVPGLFDGNAGIALVLAWIAQRTADDDLGEYAAEALPDPTHIRDLAFDTGGSGIAWATAWVGALLGRPELLATATEWCANNVPPMVSGDHLDLIDGWCGTMLATATIGKLAGCDATRDRAHALARSCADATLDGALCLRRIGLARGCTGVSMALLIAAQEFNDPTLERFGRALAETEERWVADHGGVGGRRFPSRLASRPTTSWFQGTAGYLIARKRSANDVDINEAHVRASSAYLRSAATSDSSLAYGRLGIAHALEHEAHVEVPRSLGLSRGQAGLAWSALAITTTSTAFPNPLTIL